MKELIYKNCKNFAKNLKIEIHYYNSKRISLNDELKNYVPVNDK